MSSSPPLTRWTTRSRWTRASLSSKAAPEPKGATVAGASTGSISAVIVRAHLPRSLERLRRNAVADAARGVPAHVTLLYPFVAPDELTAALRSTLAAIVRRVPPFDYRLSGPKRWPDTIYAAVEPGAPFMRLHRDLARAFPAYPIYGRRDFRLTPHITVAEGEAADDPAMLRHEGWTALPIAARATAVEVIASDAADRWQIVWRLPLGAA